eukprot:jgi/Tetstr1/449810/TSEL_036874.t1
MKCQPAECPLLWRTNYSKSSRRRPAQAVSRRLAVVKHLHRPPAGPSIESPRHRHLLQRHASQDWRGV